MSTVEFLRDLHGDSPEFVEIRHRRKDDDFHQRFFDRGDKITKATSYGLSLAKDVFFGIYPRRRAIGRADWVVPEVRWLFVDLDGKRRSIPKHLSPTITVDSGTPGHQHRYWKLTEPIPKAQAAQLNKALAHAFGGDKGATDVARVLRLPGTINSKTGRRASVVRHDPSAVYSVDVFDSLLDAVPEKDRPSGIEDLGALVQPYWQPDKRHDLALAVSGFLAKGGWPWAMVREALEALAKESGDDELKDRLRACEDTFSRFREGKPVQGFVGLREIITAADLEKLGEIARRALIPPSMAQVDALRRKKGQAFLRNRSIAQTVMGSLREAGRFLRTATDELFYFDDDRRRVLTLGGKDADVRALLDSRFGLNPVEAEARYVQAALETEAIERGEEIAVHQTSFWDRDQSRLYVDAGRGQVYLLDGEQIHSISNGEDGVFFRRQVWQSPFEADFDNPLNPRLSLVEDLYFATGEGVSLSPKEQGRVLWTHIRGLFFTEEQPTRAILTLVGDPGSGKTSTMRRVMLVLDGICGDVAKVTTQDDFDAALCANHLLVLDNVDVRLDWLPDALDRAATGTAIPKRRLYTTNEEAVFFPRCFIALTSKELPFREETVADRLLILRLARREKFIPEGKLLRQVLNDRDRIWGGLLQQLNRDVAALVARREPPSVDFRLADWAGLAIRIEPGAEALLPGLRREQAQTVLSHSSLPAIINAWLRKGGGGDWHSAASLFEVWAPIAKKLAEPSLRSPRALGKRLNDVWEALVWTFKCKRVVEGGSYRYLFPKKTDGLKGLKRRSHTSPTQKKADRL